MAFVSFIYILISFQLQLLRAINYCNYKGSFQLPFCRTQSFVAFSKIFKLDQFCYFELQGLLLIFTAKKRTYVKFALLFIRIFSLTVDFIQSWAFKKLIVKRKRKFRNENFLTLKRKRKFRNQNFLRLNRKRKFRNQFFFSLKRKHKFRYQKLKIVQRNYKLIA